MAQSSQILPQWTHPHVQTVINDNTVYTETLAAPAEPIRLVSVFTSAKGRDGVLLETETTTAFESEYGKPNFAQFGQPAYNAHAALATGVAKVWTMRVMPADASYSNLVIVAKAKVDSTDAANKKLIVRFEANVHNAVKDKSEFESLTDLLETTDPDADGFVTYPLFVVYTTGRGSYGNNQRIRLISSPMYDKENEYKNYRLEVAELENGTLTAADRPLYVTFSPDGLVDNKSVFFDDIINDEDTGSSKVNVYSVPTSIDALFALYETVAPATTVTRDTFDVFYGVVKGTSTKLPGLAYDTTHADHVSLDQPAGLPLTGGDDGTFAYVPTDKVKMAARETAINTMYSKAFRGELDRGILSKRRFPAELIFDAGYADEVKTDLISLFIKRGDAYGFLDAGIITTIDSAIAWGKEMEPYGDRLFSKEFQHYKIRDPFSGKLIPVTMTYQLASRLPIHMKNAGKQVAFTGEEVATLVGAQKNSLRPMLDADDEETKEELYLLRLNYYQSVASNLFVRGVQSTSQNIWSDLSEENNMHVLLEIKRKIETMVAGLAYDFADEEERTRFTEDADRLIATYRGIQIQTGTVRFDMNDWEKERSILHCYLEITYRTMSKRGIVEIDINKRV